MASPRQEVIEGQRTLVVDRRPPLQPKLDQLLGALTFVRHYEDVRPTGARASCELRRHRFLRLREGRHVGLDGVVRDLRIEMCADCAATCVRDISYDVSFEGEAVPIGRKGPARRDEVIGWYSGARRNRREYR